MIETATEPLLVTPKGIDVLLTVHGVPVGKDGVELQIGLSDARSLAIRLLQVVQEQERRIEVMKTLRQGLLSQRRRDEGRR